MSESAFEQLVIDSLRELKAEIVAVGATAEQGLNIALKTYEQAKETNGRVTLLETWQDQFEDDGENAASFEAGRESVKRENQALLERAWGRIEKPFIYGASALLVGIGIRLGAWFLGDIPW